MRAAPQQRIPEEQRGDLRFFAYWLANGTLIINLDEEEHDYSELLATEGPLLGQLIEGSLAEDFLPEADIALWFCELVRGDAPGDPPRLPEQVQDWRRDVVAFAQDIGWRRLPEELNAQVTAMLTTWGGSGFESVLATFANTLELDDRSCGRDPQWARRRALDMMRRLCVEGFRPEPPFAPWEIELV